MISIDSILSSTEDIEKLIKVTSDLVKIQSINPPGLEATVGEYLLAFFQEAAIDTKIFPVENGRFDVVAKIPGKSSVSPLAFTGHMDVVPVSKKELSRWDADPFSGKTHDGFLHGRGSADMKGGLASIMLAMAELVKKGIVPSQDIYLIATVDEEDNMKGSKAPLKESFLDRISLVIVCEPTNLKICTAGKGRTYANIRLTGKTSHGSHGKGQNVIRFARKLLNKIEETTFPQYKNTPYGDSFWQVLSIQAGVEPCVVPDELELKVDARLVPSHSTEKVWHEMEKHLNNLKNENPGFTGEIEIIDQREGWILPSTAPIILTVKKIYEDLNLNFDTTFFPGTSDGSILRKKGMDCIILGPGDLNCVHRENEKVSVEQLLHSCMIYFEIMRRL